VSAILLTLDQPKARQQLFNVCMDEPVDYAELAAYLKMKRGFPSVAIRTSYRSTWLDNAKAKFLLGFRPSYDLARLTDSAFDYARASDDARKIWYPG
jgi:nucleoside-diphosphate-sugar epimerase